MAFNVSYRTLNEQNIRHIYSDQKIRFVFRKTTAFKPLKEELPIPPLRLYPKRFYDYYPAYQIGIPRAPAFRSTDNDHVERIVRRICKPIECQTERRKDLHGKDGQRKEGDEIDGEDNKRGGAIKEEDDEEEEEAVEAEGGDNTSRGSKMSPREVKLMLARLQKPTQSWEKKKYNPEDRKLKEKESSIPKLPPIPPRF